MPQTVTVKNLTGDVVVLNGEAIRASSNYIFSYFAFQDDPDLCLELSNMIGNRRVDAFVDSSSTALTAAQAAALWEYQTGGGGGGTIGDSVVGGTAGSVLFVDGGGNLGQNNAQFFWDTTNANLGVGTNSLAAGHRASIVLNTAAAQENYGLNVDVTQTVANPSPNTTRGAQLSLNYSGIGTQYVCYGYNSYLENLGSGTITYSMAANNRVVNSGTGDLTNVYTTYNYLNNSATAGGGNISYGFGAYNRVRHNAPGTLANALGSYNRIENANTGTVTAANCVVAEFRNTNAGGAVSDASGVTIDGWANAGTITNSYGIFIGSSIDVGTTSWAIYSDSTSDSYLAGNLDVPNLQVTDGNIVQQRAAGSGYYNSETYSTTVTDQSEFNFYRSNNNTLGTLTTTNTGTWLGRLSWRGVSTSGTAVLSATIFAQQDGAAGFGNVPARLIFATASTGSPVNRVVINPLGLTGINQNSPQETLDVTGSFGANITAVAANRTIGDSNLGNTDHTLLVDAGAGSRIIDLPAAANNARRIIIVKVVDTNGGLNSVTVRPQAGETLDSYTNAAPWNATIQYTVVRVQSDGTNWHII